LATGDRDAFDVIVASHGPGVYRLARLLLPRADEADDGDATTT